MEGVPMKKEKEYRSRFFGLAAICFGVCILGASIVPSGLAADIYPSGKITWINPDKAGGGYDLMSRGLSPYLTKYLKEVSPGAKGGEITIKNEAAGSGQQCYNTLYTARPDGYTIGGLYSSIAAETVMSKVDFDINRFTYLLRLTITTRILITNNKSGFSTWEEMLKSAKTKELKWGVAALGRGLHVDSLIVEQAVKMPVRYIAWGGSPELMNALLRNDVQIALVSEDTVKSLLDAKEAKVLTEFGETSGYPGVPSIKDLGYPDLANKLGSHRFVIGPPGLPKEQTNILIAAYKKALNDPELLAWAKKSEIPFNPAYGEDADRAAKRMFKFYQEDVKPLLQKYVK
jgi:tripartite-type tricarboxylate transporter receptor subunit TctC